MRAEAMQAPAGEFDGDDAPTTSLFHDQVDREVLDIELCVVLERLLIKRMQHGVPGAIRGRTCSLCGSLSESRRHTTEGSLVNLAVFRA